MQNLRLEHLFECSQETFWERVFFDEEYNRRLFLEELKFWEWKELEAKDEGPRVRRVTRAVPRIGDLPGPLKAVIGERAGYEERGVYERATHSYEAKILPSRLADRITVTLAMTTEPSGETRCRRIVQSTVTARIMMVGSLLEQRLVSDMSLSYEKGAEFTNRFLAEKGWR